MNKNKLSDTTNMKTKDNAMLAFVHGFFSISKISTNETYVAAGARQYNKIAKEPSSIHTLKKIKEGDTEELINDVERVAEDIQRILDGTLGDDLQHFAFNTINMALTSKPTLKTFEKAVQSVAKTLMRISCIVMDMELNDYTFIKLVKTIDKERNERILQKAQHNIEQFIIDRLSV